LILSFNMGGRATISLRDIVAYLLYKHKCLHPYRISRILVLANWRALEESGEPIVRFSIEGFEAGFTIPEIASIKEAARRGEEKCVRPNEEEKCLEYVCNEPPKIPRKHAEILEKVMEEVRGLDDASLNRLVIRDPRYKPLLERGGF